MNKILQFFIELRNAYGEIWVENGRINYSAPEEFQSDQTDNFIFSNKDKIISILTSNEIASGEDFRKKVIFKGDSRPHYPLSPAQERLWFIEQFEEGTDAYHVPMVLELENDTNMDGVRYALQQVVLRHEVLRSTIEKGEDGDGRQLVGKDTLSIDEVSLTTDEALDALIQSEIRRPFDLSKEYPIRAFFYTVTPKDQAHPARVVLLVNIHHIACDGWSIDIFRSELLAYYEAYMTQDTSFSLVPLTIQYKDYALWQRNYLTGDVLANQINYWKEKLSGYETLALPTDYRRPSQIDYKGRELYFTINQETSDRLRSLAKSRGTTLHSVLLSSVNILFGKYSGQEDIVIGSPIANRQYHQTTDLIGFFVNTQVNRTVLNGTQSYSELIDHVHQEQVSAQFYQDLPFEKLVDELGIDRDLSRHPLFQVMFGVQSLGSSTASSQQSYFAPYEGEVSGEVSKFDLSLFIDDSGETLSGRISYATSLFKSSSITRLISHYQFLLDQLVSLPDRPYSEISLLDRDEYDKILLDWNATSHPYPEGEPLHVLFARQASQTPEAIAVVFEGESLTYNQLEERSNQLARRIRSYYSEITGSSLTADTFIGLYLERSLEMLVGIMGVLKSGGVCVPLNPEYPEERINFLLEDSGASLILTQRDLLDRSTNALDRSKLLHIDLSETYYEEESVASVGHESQSTDLAYLIYTSGTTGRPKGVMISHGSIVNKLSWMAGMYELGSSDVVLHKAPYTFDVSIWELLLSPVSGAKLVLAKPEGHKDSSYLYDLIATQEVTLLHFVPSMLETYNDYLSSRGVSWNASVRYLLCSGEALSDRLVEETYSKAPGPDFKIYNQYGPTEASITYSEVLPGEEVSIGRPIQNTKVYVLDRYERPVPVGVVGELYLGGVGLSRGYHKNADLTTSKFIRNPFSAVPSEGVADERLYKTGDLVRWRSDGNLEYLGRNDHQVKIRGYRVELGEVEQALEGVAGIRQSCVLVKEQEIPSGVRKYLVGYYVSDLTEELSHEFLSFQLRSVLPDHMIPDAFMCLPVFPLTANGKLDKDSLPDPLFSSGMDEYVAPVTASEEESSRIWGSVLGLDRVGITDDFFRIGGNSILAIQVSHRMSQSLKTEIKVADVFLYKTISQLLLNSQGQGEELIRKTGDHPTVLSFAQERLWFIEQFEEGTNAYHMPMVLELKPETKEEAVHYALDKIVQRHEILRSTIEKGENQEGIQRVHTKPLSLEEEVLDLEDDLESLLKSDINKPFDLSNKYPIKVKFYKIRSSCKIPADSFDRIIVLVNIHHIACDGWSKDIIQKELLAYCDAFQREDKHFNLPPLTIQYKDYATWQRTYLTGEVLQRQINYWKEKLTGYETLALPTDYVRPHQVDYKGAYESFVIEKQTSEKLRKLARDHGTTMHTVLLSSLNILLGKYTGQRDIVVGSPIANRHHHQTAELIGFFVNTQVNRSRLEDDQSYASLIDVVHQEQVASQSHQDLPFEKLVDELGIDRDLSRHPIFQVLLAVQSFGRKKADHQKKYFKPYGGSPAYEVEKFDLSIFIDDSGEKLEGTISYATSLFHKDTIVRLVNHYTYLLSQLANDPKQPYSQISLLDTNEYQRVILDWNSTEKQYSDELTIHELFEEQVKRTPDEVALVFEGEELTYQELNEKSNQLARHIRKKYEARKGHELKPDALIALCLERSLEMIIGMLGVLKAGGAYVPIDPDYPEERIDYLLKDTESALILTQKRLVKSEGLALPEDKVLYIDLAKSYYQTEETSDLQGSNTSNDLAYVIYTSGTSGKPKGVMIEHKSVTLFCQSVKDTLSNYPPRHFLQYASIVFDASVMEIFTSLLYGLKLIVVNNQERSDKELLESLVATYSIDTAILPPVLLETLSSQKFKSLKNLLVGGEAFSLSLVKQWSSNRSIVNAYGPTETTVCATMHVFNGTETTSLIGKPLFGKKAYVLDTNMIPVPVGVIGELHVGGPGLARGYLNSETLTKRYFVQNPFAVSEGKESKNTRLYKTGDLVRWQEDGSLEYIGRNDDQVKIRGYRIELEEIEYALSTIGGIKQSAVLVKERKTAVGTTKFLVCYYVMDLSDEVSDTFIKSKLSSILPSYMVPDVYVSLASFPATINGKLDKNALPDPLFGSDAEKYIAPASETELEACKIWEEILGVERVGLSDDFFRVGGNSIMAIQVSHRMSQVLGVDVRVADIFKNKNISKLLAFSKGQDQVRITKTDKNTAVLSFAQERLWFIEQFEGGTHAYHMPFLFELSPEADQQGIRHALQQMVMRHEVLRSTIEKGENQEGIQRVHSTPLVIGEEIASGEEQWESLIREEVRRPFDLQKDYPMRASFYKSRETDRVVLLLNFHHIAFDGWSISIFHRELKAYYDAYLSENAGFGLAPLSIQYKDYAIWQRAYLSGEKLAKQIYYWKQKLTGYENLNLPTDFTRPAQFDYEGAREHFEINEKTSEKLRSLAAMRGTTLYSVLLSSINILLTKYTGQKDLVIGSPVANRHFYQTAGLIGFFVNTQVNRTILKASQSFVELIDSVHREQVEAQLHQDLPFEKLVNELGIDRDLSRHPIFQVMFGVQDFMAGSEDHHHNQYLKPFAGPSSGEVAKFDLSIFIDDSQGSLQGSINYSTSLFKQSTITRLIVLYQNLLEGLIESPYVPYNQISLLKEDEYQKVVVHWNKTEKSFPVDTTIHKLFEIRAAKHPNKVALVYEGERITYKDLNKKSDQLAVYILKKYKQKTGKELQPDTLIALCLERGLEMIIGILGTMKAGGGYLPIDTSYPQSRVDYLLEDSYSELILTQRRLAENENLRSHQDKTLFIDLSENLYQDQDVANLVNRNQSRDLAYVIYTSGTTGNPKGVMVEHQGVINLVFNQKEKLNLRPSSRVIQFASYIFDASVWEIFGTLCTGGTLFILSSGIRENANLLAEYLEEQEVSVATLPPAILSLIEPRPFEKLETLVVAGEVCAASLMDRWSEKRRLFNAYGPTEATVCTSMHEYMKGSSHTNIGRPLSNVNCYVLDTDLCVVPDGVVGELYIGGAGVARGYLNNENLTVERFIDNPVLIESGEVKDRQKLYKTGDLVRWMPDGQLEYLGRNDDQVKIRGYRIEMEEVSHALSQISEISQACVLFQKRSVGTGDEMAYLAGYYVLNSTSQSTTRQEVYDKLVSTLPLHMIPDVLVNMKSFPRTVNGKIDKKALIDQDVDLPIERYVAPSTEMELAVCKIWKELLGLKRVGINDGFFGIGGNSMLAIQASHQISQKLGIEVKVSDIFKHKTILKLLRHCLNKKQVVIPSTDKNCMPLSFAQERLWFIEQYEGGTNAYHVPIVLELEEKTNEKGLQYALDRIVTRHEVLRSTIEKRKDGEGIQRIHSDSLMFDECVYSQSDSLEELITSYINQPFKLDKEYPVRVKFFKLSPDTKANNNIKRVMVINIHHIATDGWSIDLFMKELYAYYEAFIDQNTNFNLPSLAIQYKDYAQWQRSYLNNERLADQVSFWKKKLEGYETLALPCDFARPSQINYSGAQEHFTIPKEVSNELRSLAKLNDTTLHCVLLSGVSILLGKYSGQEDIVIGSPFANRHYHQTADLIGFFINTQVNRTKLRADQSYASLISEVHKDQITSQLYQDLPFEKLVDELGVVRDQSRHPIFQVMFGVQGFGRDVKKNQFFRTLTNSEAYQVAKFDLSIFIDDSGDELRGLINYATSIFRSSTIANLIRHFLHLLEQLVNVPDRPYSKISLLSYSEYEMVTKTWNATNNFYHKDTRIHELFEKQVEKFPENVALTYEGQTLTYKQLNERSNQLAWSIRAEYKKKVGKALEADTLIPLLLERNLEMVVGILAVLKAGGAYVPLGTDYPQKKIDFLLQDTHSSLVLSQRGLIEKGNLRVSNSKVLYTDFTELCYQEENMTNLPKYSTSRDLAYVIYTSGTTGTPKGVMVEHTGLVNLVNVQSRQFGLDERSRMLQFASYAFDASVWEIFGALSVGASLAIVSADTRKDAIQLGKYLEDQRITSAILPPALLALLEKRDLVDLRTLVVGGEACTLDVMTAWSAGRQFINAYGPTECTVCVSMHEFKEGSLSTDIGRPADNTSFYVLDSNLQPVPAGFVGELYIGGVGVARGYLNNKELTEARFISNPLDRVEPNENSPSRLYRTGDMVRWLPTGSLEYIGRKDDQVKVRGYRIELSEIEHVLLKVSGIAQCCVLLRERNHTKEDKDKYLVCYYTLASGAEELSKDHIYNELANFLPDYMIPNFFLKLDAFPLTSNGKLDKKGLPLPDFRSLEENYVAPQTPIELDICAIWEDVLNVERVGVKDDFFKVGGNSILAIRAVKKMNEVLPQKLSIRDLFLKATIRELLS
ncbi:amino acid adenylation domain-containing protein [Ekhidna sp.]|uniref:amino acid adenylation domain-containing protein n=1 Tax=Ekhidna sp. TaxID=2608089 RepID=UPI003CCC04F6